MLKKIILSVMAAVLLTGSESMFANETNAAAEVRSWVKQPRQQEFDRYFNALTKAYRENDRETMGQMLRKMNQFWQNQQKAKVVPGKRGQNLPKRRGSGNEHAGRFRGDLDKNRPSFWHGGMCWHGRGMAWHSRGMDGRGQRMGWQGQGMGRRGRAMDRQDRGVRRRKMNVPQHDDMPGEEFDWDW